MQGISKRFRHLIDVSKVRSKRNVSLLFGRVHNIGATQASGNEFVASSGVRRSIIPATLL